MTSHQLPQLDLKKLPPDTWLTVNQVAKRCSVQRDDIKTMIGVLEKQAGGLPQETDAQGKTYRVISEATLLPYFETAAYLMRVEQITATLAMEKTLHMGVNHYLAQLSRIFSHLVSLQKMPRELRDATTELLKAAQTPHRVALTGSEAVLQALDDAANNTRHWRIAAGVLLTLLIITVIIVGGLLVSR